MHDSIENQTSVWTSLIAASAARERRARQRRGNSYAVGSALWREAVATPT